MTIKRPFFGLFRPSLSLLGTFFSLFFLAFFVVLGPYNESGHDALSKLLVVTCNDSRKNNAHVSVTFNGLRL